MLAVVLGFAVLVSHTVTGMSHLHEWGVQFTNLAGNMTYMQMAGSFAEEFRMINLGQVCLHGYNFDFCVGLDTYFEKISGRVKGNILGTWSL